LVSKEKYDTCRLNGFGKNNTINFFPLSFVFSWKCQRSIFNYCSSIYTLTLEKDCWRLDSYELCFILWSKWIDWQKKYSVLLMASYQYHNEGSLPIIATKQVPDFDNKLWSIYAWFPNSNPWHSIPIRDCRLSAQIEKQKCQNIDLFETITL